MREVQGFCAPNSAGIANGNNTILGQANLLVAQMGGQTVDNVLNTATVAAQGAQQGLQTYVSLTAEGAVNVVPLVGGQYYGPGPVGGGLGGEINVPLNGSLPTISPSVSVGQFGLSGDAGITFTAPGLSGPQTYNLSLSGGAGPGGAVNISWGPGSIVPTNVSVTIGVGFGWEASGNLPIPVNGRPAGQ